MWWEEIPGAHCPCHSDVKNRVHDDCAEFIRILTRKELDFEVPAILHRSAYLKRFIFFHRITIKSIQKANEKANRLCSYLKSAQSNFHNKLYLHQCQCSLDC